MPSWTSVARNGRRTGDDVGPARTLAMDLLTGSVSLAARAGLTSQRAEALLERLGLAEFVARRVPTDVVRTGTEQVDFRRSRAYMRSRLELGVRINLEGREPEGVVPAGDYEAVRSDLVDLLSGMRTPDGGPVFEAVVPREDVFEGPHLDAAPDLVTVPAEFDHLPSASIRGQVFGPPAEPWEHKRTGMIAAAGETVDPAAGLDGAHVFDVAPTVLATFGVPASDRMDGRTLPVVESAGTRSFPSFSPQQRVETNDDEVEQRLADLGYLG